MRDDAAVGLAGGMRDEQRTLVLDGTLTELRRLAAWVHDAGADWRLEQRTLFALDLVLQEAVDNLIRHAVSDRPGAIAVTMTLESGRVVACVEDAGDAFDPTAHIRECPGDNLDAARIGGEGIGLIRCFCDEVRYERADARNRLFLTKRL